KLLINNAGYGIGDSFTSDKVPIEKSLDLVKVHVNAPVRFARAAIKNMEKRGEGYIINVASLAAFFPRKGSLYAPTKSFLVSLSACLKAELTDKQLKIKVQSLCPGYVRTDFHSRGTYDDTNYDDLENQGFIVLTPQEVVLFDSEKKGIIVVPGYETAQVKSYLIDNSYLLQELEE
ncbi:MAG: SDR family NAD(P)-dependent oxidoreductase, partial [Candidatus Hodarchaeales archaeon]